jgi:hypothetical protein
MWQAVSMPTSKAALLFIVIGISLAAGDAAACDPARTITSSITLFSNAGARCYTVHCCAEVMLQPNSAGVREGASISKRWLVAQQHATLH